MGPTMVMNDRYNPYSIYIRELDMDLLKVSDPPLLSNSYPLSFMAA
jgi:hypothetical protein